MNQFQNLTNLFEGEFITSIEEIEETKMFDNLLEYSGFIVKTNEQEIKLLISNFQCCCENWGYFITNDNIEDFIGAKLLEVKIVDKILNVEKLQEIFEGGVMYVNLETSKGTLQFTAYNEHNGYYGHDAKVISKNLNYECCL